MLWLKDSVFSVQGSCQINVRASLRNLLTWCQQFLGVPPTKHLKIYTYIIYFECKCLFAYAHALDKF